jgi:hypothetical protein
MATNSNSGNGLQLLVVNQTGGITIIDPSTPLKRLNYFDGKFLRAADLDLEQSYLRELVALSNQGMGSGVVYGYDTVQGDGDTVQIGPGLAIAPSGQVLLLQSTVTQSIQDLIDASKAVAAQAPDASGKSGPGVFSDCIQVAAPPPTTVVPVSDIYVIVICAAEALCGQEDVYGIACQDACVTSTDRPYRLDGIVLRAIPLQLLTPFPTSKQVSIGADVYLRSKVAHSWFADEVAKHPNAISRDGLLSDVWCMGAGYDNGCCEVPLAVVARSGASTVFLDAWIVRRERIDAPAKRYWQWKMRMRPWDVFLAQILQFQCQLADLLSGIVTPGGRGGDPCASQSQALNEALQFIEQVQSGLASYSSLTPNSTLAGLPAPLALSLNGIVGLRDKLQSVIKSSAVPTQSKDRILIKGGIIELPSSGYLPVVNGTSVSVNDQVRALLGDGLDLRFCITTADYAAHVLEEAQHMERISLLQGIDDPNNKPHVDILVPDGILSNATKPKGGLYDAKFVASTDQTGAASYLGVAREEILDTGGTALYVALAGVSEPYYLEKLQVLGSAYAASKSADKATPFVLNGDLGTSAFIKRSATNNIQFADQIANAGSVARRFNLGTSNTTSAFVSPSTLAMASYRYRYPVVGSWLTAQSDKEIKSLQTTDQTQASLRYVVSTINTAPLAFELIFNGKLSISDVSALGPVLQGTLNGIVAVGILKEDPSQQSTAEFLFTERFNWPVTLTYVGDDSNGSIVLDLTLSSGPVDTQNLLRFKKAMKPSQLTYSLAFVNVASGHSIPLPIAELDLTADSDAVNSSNRYHKYAEYALDIVQASLLVSEPDFKTNAEASLFTVAPPSATEFIIQAVRDWVLFTKRREEQCSQEAVPAPLPPRRYRVFNWTVENMDEALSSVMRSLQSIWHNPDPTEQFKNVLEAIGIQDPLIITFPGGSPSISQTSPSDTLGAWDSFNPGAGIYYAAAGAVGETDAGLQMSRIQSFEDVIVRGSTEDASNPAQKDAIIPFPPSIVPDGVEGIMIFITVAIERQILAYAYGMDQAVNGSPPRAQISFQNTKPEAKAAQDFVANLKTYLAQQNTIQGVRQIWVASTGTTDPATLARGNAIQVLLGQANLLTPDGQNAGVQTVALSDAHKLGITRRLNDPNALNGISDVILVEFQNKPDSTAPTVSTKVENASYDVLNRTLSMKATIANNGTTPVRLGEFNAGSVRFLDSSVSKDTSGYPEDLLKPDGLTVSDNSPLAPGETRTVMVNAAGANWDVPDPSFAGNLLFYDASGKRQTVAIVPNPSPSALGGGATPPSAARTGRIIMQERNASGNMEFVGDATLDVQFDANDQLSGGELPDATDAWLIKFVDERSVSSIILIGDQPSTSQSAKNRIAALRKTLGIELDLLESETKDEIMTVAEAQTHFGTHAAELLKHLSQPSPVQELILLKAG